MVAVFLCAFSGATVSKIWISAGVGMPAKVAAQSNTNRQQSMCQRKTKANAYQLFPPKSAF